MEDGPSQGKRARLENDPGSCYSSAGQPSDLFPWRNSEKGSDYLTQVFDDVSMYRHKTLDLENPPGATLTIGHLDDTIYSEEEDEVNGWGKFYLPEIVNMQVVGVVEGTSCPSDQLVLMTCEDRKLYAYDGEMLHLVASSLRQLHYKGIKYPAPERYYKGEAFKHKRGTKRGAPKQPGHNTAATVSERIAPEKATEVKGRKEKKREMQNKLLHSCRYNKAVTVLIPPPQLPPLQSWKAQAVKHWVKHWVKKWVEQWVEQWVTIE